MSQAVSSSVIITPSPGSRPDAVDPRNRRTSDAADRAAERNNTAPRTDFAAAASEASAGQQADRKAAEAVVERRAEAAEAGIPKLRRRTDAGGPPAPGIELPAHMERRRAWREAKGLNTFHTQSLAQTEETTPDSETRKAATLAYRENGGRGKLDIDLAQKFSLTV
ncbi:hypothetical protein V6B08_14140 [Ferrovibrio sp. MS7]|uniref:hypothetical protein n=1 Tax=Ferrovibrio plantarum TaxID=3119164 RepID=UPI00313501CE